MEENTLYALIDRYLTGKLDDDEKEAFISKMKADVELMKKVEIERGITEIIQKEERDSLRERLMSRYTEERSSRKEQGIFGFNQDTDNKLIEYMNAAYIKNIDLLADDSDVLDMETLLKFLEGGQDKGEDSEKDEEEPK